MNWFSVQHHDGVAYVSIFGDIGCLGAGAEEFKSAVSDAETVDLTIDSTGGCSLTALAVHDFLKSRRCRATITGRCHSAAVTVAMACGHIAICRDARILVHSPCDFAFGDSEHLRWRADALEKTLIRVENILTDRTEQPRGVIAQWLQRDTYFDAFEALNAGLVDQVIVGSQRAEIAKSIQTNSPAEDSSEEFFNFWLRSMPKVVTRSREEFLRNFLSWMTYNVSEAAGVISSPVADSGAGREKSPQPSFAK